MTNFIAGALAWVCLLWLIVCEYIDGGDPAPYVAATLASIIVIATLEDCRR